jgi:hypothetical protein
LLHCDAEHVGSKLCPGFVLFRSADDDEEGLLREFFGPGGVIQTPAKEPVYLVSVA